MGVGDNSNNQNSSKNEKKWQKIWEDQGLFKAPDFIKRKKATPSRKASADAKASSSAKATEDRLVDKTAGKAYILIEFPYLSGDGLHVGHARSYTALDVVARKKRMQGYNVLYPIGWDAFGLPTENYAIKTGIHPQEITKKNIRLFKRQIKRLGLSFDWSREINTSSPQYYKWTQWIFLKMFEKGLAYVADIPINWCPQCKIGLANEEVIAGNCERCGHEVERRNQKQWMLKITAYADRLLEGLKTVDYLEKITDQQINWIGRSEGVVIRFSLGGNNQYIETFTTRADTLFGVTALVIAPEHTLINDYISKVLNRKEVEQYIVQSKKKSEFERTELDIEKTGVPLKGLYAINPINNEKIPVWIGDYVVSTYGGGAVMLVPAHDKRDFAFAQKYGIEIRQVIQGGDVRKQAPNQSKHGTGQAPIPEPYGHGTGQAFVDYGVLIHSGQFNGLESKQAIKKIGAWLERKKFGKQQVQYKLRDWVFSRQHYWGEPIPLVYCENCAVKAKNPKIKNKEFSQGELLNPGWIPVKEKDLPVELPYVKKYKPTKTGKSPLANIHTWVNTVCPKCGGNAKRETDTMPNWAGSNWYYLAYVMQGISNLSLRASRSERSNLTRSPRPSDSRRFAFPISKYRKAFNYWMPVDLYNGGMEHTTLHLLYSRFWYKFLYDIGVVPTKEPYKKRRSHGMVLAQDGRKMSKSFGNVINPDDIVNMYGADVFRVYEMFMGPFDQAISWDPKTIQGVDRFITKVRNCVITWMSDLHKWRSDIHEELETLKHQTIKKVTNDIDNMKFNTAVAALMEYTNSISNFLRQSRESPDFIEDPRQSRDSIESGQFPISKQYIETLLLLLAPFAPHISEELWHQIHPKLSEKQSICNEDWPTYDAKLVKSKRIQLVIQINGKVRDKVNADADILKKQAEKLALEQEKIQKYVKGKKIKKVIFIKGKLINIVLR